MKQVPINSDRARLKFLRRALATSQRNQEFGSLVTPRLQNQMTSRIEAFDGLVDQVTAAYGARIRAVEEEDRQLFSLAEAISNFYTGIINRTQVMGHSREVLEQYRLPSDNGRPLLAEKRDALEVAQRILRGETQAVAMGYPATTLPAATDLQPLVDSAKAAGENVDDTNLTLSGIRIQMQAQRKIIDDLISEIAEYLRYSLRTEAAPTRRSIMRAFGFRFRGDGTSIGTGDGQGETPTGDPTTEPSDGGGGEPTTGNGDGSGGSTGTDGNGDTNGSGNDSSGEGDGSGSQTDGSGQSTQPVTTP